MTAKTVKAEFPLKNGSVFRFHTDGTGAIGSYKEGHNGAAIYYNSMNLTVDDMTRMGEMIEPAA